MEWGGLCIAYWCATELRGTTTNPDRPEVSACRDDDRCSSWAVGGEGVWCVKRGGVGLNTAAGDGDAPRGDGERDGWRNAADVV